MEESQLTSKTESATTTSATTTTATGETRTGAATSGAAGAGGPAGEASEASEAYGVHSGARRAAQPAGGEGQPGLQPGQPSPRPRLRGLSPLLTTPVPDSFRPCIPPPSCIPRRRQVHCRHLPRGRRRGRGARQGEKKRLLWLLPPLLQPLLPAHWPRLGGSSGSELLLNPTAQPAAGSAADVPHHLCCTPPPPPLRSLRPRATRRWRRPSGACARPAPPTQVGAGLRAACRAARCSRQQAQLLTSSHQLLNGLPAPPVALPAADILRQEGADLPHRTKAGKVELPGAGES